MDFKENEKWSTMTFPLPHAGEGEDEGDSETAKLSSGGKRNKT